MTDPEERRVRRSVAIHTLAVVIFALLAVSGGGALTVPFVITGLAGSIGAALIAVAVWRGHSYQRTVRLAMAAAAVAVLITGVLLAPSGLDRTFVITVAIGLAALLALFALLAGDRPRTA
jgi:hypothetical protein